MRILVLRVGVEAMSLCGRAEYVEAAGDGFHLKYTGRFQIIVGVIICAAHASVACRLEMNVVSFIPLTGLIKRNQWFPSGRGCAAWVRVILRGLCA